MSRQIALLRGINVGGHRVSMDHLRGLFGEMGFTDVESHLASGNVIFTAPDGPAAELERRVEEGLAATLGFGVATFIRTPAELADVVARARDAAKEAEAEWGPEASAYVAFTKTPPSQDDVAGLQELESGTDRFVMSGREIFWLLAGKLSASPLFKGDSVGKALRGTPHTLRKLSSLEKLLTKHGPIP